MSDTPDLEKAREELRNVAPSVTIPDQSKPKSLFNKPTGDTVNATATAASQPPDVATPKGTGAVGASYSVEIKKNALQQGERRPK